MNGNISIEDILRQHTVHELRDLISQLEREGSGKQTELQLMVGSTYHDFIQSADTIASMQNESKLMNEQLESFGQHAKSIAMQTQDMLAAAAQAAASSGEVASSRSRAGSTANTLTVTPHVPVSAGHTQSPQWSCGDITSNHVWTFLDLCDVFSACQIITTAEAVLHLTPTPPAACSLPQSASADLMRLLSARASQLRAMAPSSGQREGVSLLQRCGEVSYLHQTVVDDCHLLFLYGQCDAEESARSMAGLAGLSLCTALRSTSSMSGNAGLAVVAGGELLGKYLECTELRLAEICQLLGEDSEEEGDLEEVSELLLAAVRLLQQTVLNVYVIFFKKTSHGRSTGKSGRGKSGGNSGLFCNYLVDFLVQCVSDSEGERDRLEEAVREEVTQQFPEAAVLTAWRGWVGGQTKALQAASETALGRLCTAHDVAAAQRLTMHQCLTFLPSGTATGPAGPGGMGHESVWSAACSLLMLPLATASAPGGKRHSVSGAGGDRSGGSVLWSLVFRKPFITQVEKMLKVSCRDIFHRTRARVLRCLLQLGGAGRVLHPDLLREEEASMASGDRAKHVRGQQYASRLVVDPLSLEVKLRGSVLNAPGNSSGSGSGSGRGKHAHVSPQSSSSSLVSCSRGRNGVDEWSWVDAYTGSRERGGGRRKGCLQRVATSAEVYAAAESIRNELEGEISEYLLSDVFQQQSGQGQDWDQDREAGSALARSLQVQCCELVGQVLVLLRVVAGGLTSSLRLCGSGRLGGKRSHRHPSNREKQNIHTPEAVNFLESDGEASLQSGLLLISRLAWLLRTPQGSFLEHALQIQRAPRDKADSAPCSPKAGAVSPGHRVHEQYMTSLEQLQSAFDIADTNGDGVITFAEAVEAVNALWISDDVPGASCVSGPPSLDFLWFGSSSDSDTSSQQSLYPLITFTMAEFRLVCAQMIPPPAAGADVNVAGSGIGQKQGEVNGTIGGEENMGRDETFESHATCLQSCLRDLVNSTLLTFADTLATTHLSPSLIAAVQRDCPLTPLSDSGGEDAGRIMRGSFRSGWMALSLSSGSGEGDEEGESEVLDAPVRPSSAVFHLLSSLSQVSHAAFLSIDTTQALSLLPAKHEGVGDANNSTCLASAAQQVLYSKGLECYLQQLNHLRGELSKELEQGRGSQQVFEDYSVQAVFDLTLCERTLLAALGAAAAAGTGAGTATGPSSGLLEKLQLCRAEWEQSVDPIIWSLMSPLVGKQVSAYLLQHRLFLPAPSSLFSTVSPLTSADDSADSAGSGSSSVTKKGRSEFANLFPVSGLAPPSPKKSSQADPASSQFSLLPLPLTATLAPFGGKTREVLVLRGGQRSEAKKGAPGSLSARGNDSSTSNGVRSVEQSKEGERKKGKGWFF